MKSTRQQEIIKMLEENNVVVSQKLVEHFNVSLETIRRDLDQLQKLGILTKVYGGAKRNVSSSTAWPSLSVRQESNRSSKQIIAKRAIDFIEDRSVIALDAGTTISEFCRLLPSKFGITAICSDLHNAELLLKSGVDKVCIMGGFLSPDGTSWGDFSSDFFSSVTHLDTFVFSSDGVDFENGLTTNLFGINELKRQFLKKAKLKILLADHSKFEQKGTYRVCPLTDIDIFITDSQTPESVISRIQDMGIEVIIAE